MARELGAGDRVLVADAQLARLRAGSGRKNTGTIERVLDPLLANVQRDRVLKVRFDDGTVDHVARRQVRRLR